MKLSSFLPGRQQRFLLPIVQLILTIKNLKKKKKKKKKKKIQLWSLETIRCGGADEADGAGGGPIRVN